MIPIWVLLLALLAVFIENGVRAFRRERAWTRSVEQFCSERDTEFQRLHLLLDQLRHEGDLVQRERAVRQLHAELSKVHRTFVNGTGA